MIKTEKLSMLFTTEEVQTKALNEVTLHVEQGEFVAIMGPSGCGKSTLLRLAAGVLRPERGRVANRLAARQALLPQNPKALFVCDTVAEELREWQRGCGYGDDAVDAALGRFSLAAHAARHPYDLSGGQQQLLAFAKILLTDPDLLLLDEPTKGLDTPTKRALADAVRSCARSGATVVLVTHDLAFAARVADRATMLFDGEAACTEPAEEFFAGNLFYRPVPDAFFRTWRAGAGEPRADDGPDGGSSAPSRPGPLVSSGGGLRTSLEGEPLPAAGAGASGAHTLDPNDGTAR